jgi:iron complex outermembrane receptor protein
MAMLGVAPIFAQSDSERDSVIHLNEVVINESRQIEFSTGHFTLKPDSNIRQLSVYGSLADVLRKFGYGHMRSYGQSGLSTPSFRGTGASHTAVLWNGINIQSSLNGQFDLSLIPGFFIDDAEMQSGGSASLFGSGAVGGVIHLNNITRFDQGTTLSVATSAGSFNNYLGAAGATFSRKRFVSSTRVFYRTGKNNFSYLNRNVTPQVKAIREHSAVRQWGILHQDSWRNNHHLVTLRLWFQDNDVEVPNPATVIRPSFADQHDKFFRPSLSWHYNDKRISLAAQSAYAHYLVDYNDPFASISSVGIFENVVSYFESTFNVSPLIHLTGGINHTLEKGSIEEYGTQTPLRHRIAFYSAVKFDNKKISGTLSGRQELIDGAAILPALSLATEYAWTPAFTTFASLSRSYRVPTFNDLHWIGAGATGNPDLLTETSWGEETGIRYHIKRPEFLVSTQVSLFSNFVDDWIQWSPVGLAWTPVNLRKVWSRGMESSATFAVTKKRWQYAFDILYSLTKSTNRAIYSATNANELNKQLFFTPQHEGSARVTITHGRFSGMVAENFTGKQYTDGSNAEFLAMRPYTILNAWLSYQLQKAPTSLNVFVESNNILGTQYESRPGYPMPVRNYKCGITIKFNKPNQQ